MAASNQNRLAPPGRLLCFAVLVACAGAGASGASPTPTPPSTTPDPDKEAAQLGPRTFVPSGRGTRVYAGRDGSPRAARDPLARLVERELRELAKRQSGRDPEPVGSLAAVARDIAEAGRGDDYGLFEFLRIHHGVPQPDVRLNLIRGSIRPDEVIAADLRAEFLSSHVFTQEEITGLGVGIARGTDTVTVVVILRGAALDLEPVTKRIEVGQSVPLVFALPPGFKNPQVVVKVPAERLGRMPIKQRGKKLASEIRCGDGPGVYQAEILAEATAGPEVLANFPVYCGVEAETRYKIPGRVAAPDMDPAAVEKSVLNLVNESRRAAGLRALVRDQRLDEVARTHSIDMARRGVAAHRFDDTGDASDRVRAAGVHARVVAENVGSHAVNVQSGDQGGPRPRGTGDQGLRADDIHNGFMSSPGHRHNVLHPEVTHIGIALERSEKDPSGTTWYVTELFAAF